MPNRIPIHRSANQPKTEAERHRIFKSTRTDKVAQRFYTSRPWREFRAAYLAAHPLCELCRTPTAATIVDHLLEIKDRPDKALDWDNVQALCLSCHQAKNGRSVQARR